MARSHAERLSHASAAHLRHPPSGRLARFGFMLPVSTPPNAIVYGSGMVPITRMIRSGIVFDRVGAVVITLCVTLMAAIVGLR